MTSQESRLFLVERIRVHQLHGSKVWVFRTRKAAREYAKSKAGKVSVYRYLVRAATWGPEQ